MIATKAGFAAVVGFVFVMSIGCDLGTYGERVEQAGTSFKPDVSASAGNVDGVAVKPNAAQGSGTSAARASGSASK